LVDSEQKGQGWGR